jgi:hypothetical protein
VKELDSPLRADIVSFDDLDQVGRVRLDDASLDHVAAILRAIGESDPLAHFGPPGPLVHFAEKFYRKGYEELLREAAAATPTYHFTWMLARIVNDPDAESTWARDILRSYASSPTAPEAIRERAAEAIASK